MCVLLLCTRGWLGWKTREPQSKENRVALGNNGNPLDLGDDGCPTIPVSLVTINSTHAGRLNVNFMCISSQA